MLCASNEDLSRRRTENVESRMDENRKYQRNKKIMKLSTSAILLMKNRRLVFRGFSLQFGVIRKHITAGNSDLTLFLSRFHSVALLRMANYSRLPCHERLLPEPRSSTCFRKQTASMYKPLAAAEL